MSIHHLVTIIKSDTRKQRRKVTQSNTLCFFMFWRPGACFLPFLITKFRGIILISFSIILITLTSCQQVVFIDLGDYDSKLVVHGILSPDTFPRIYLSESTFYYDYDEYRNRFHFITGATVSLKRNDTKIYLKPDSTYEPASKNKYVLMNRNENNYDSILVYFYTDTLRPKPGEFYELEISSGNRRVTSTVTIPLPVEIDSVKIIRNDKTKDLYGEGFKTAVYAETYFKEAIKKDEYYRLNLTGWYKEPSYNNPYDSNIRKFSYTTDLLPGVTLGDINKIIYGDLECGTYYIGADKNKKHIKVSVERLTEETGRYLESLVKQKENENNPFTEPVIVKSNIEGGLGIFGAFSSSKQKEAVYYCK